MTEPRKFLKVRTAAQRDAERFTLSIRKSPADEAEDRRAAKAEIRRLIGAAR